MAINLRLIDSRLSMKANVKIESVLWIEDL